MIADRLFPRLDNSLCGFASIYDRNVDGIIDTDEAFLRYLTNHVCCAIYEQCDI